MNTDDLQQRIDAELRYFDSDEQRSAFEAARILPRQQIQKWSWGEPSVHACIVIASNSQSEIVYCPTGFGPESPWSTQRIGEQEMGMDSDWHSYLYEAFVTSTLWPAGTPRGFMRMASGERAIPGERVIEGTEFDWFGVDERGQFALFATAGCGPIPRSVRGQIAAHDAIGDSLEIAGWGSTELWQSYSNAGLFVYNWSASQGRYVRVAEPSAAVAAILSVSLSALPELPELPFSFRDVLAIEVLWRSEK